MGRLEIRVCGARNIADTQKVGVPDPYVKVKMGENKKTQIKYKTRVIENALNPVWNELIKFQVSDEDSTQVLFEVWNDNIMIDDLLGSYHLSLNGLHRGVVKDMWVILSGSKVSSAELHLRVLAVDFGSSPEPNERVVSSIEDDNFVAPSHQTSRPARKNSLGSSDNSTSSNTMMTSSTKPYVNSGNVNINNYPNTLASPYSYPAQVVQPQPVQPNYYIPQTSPYPPSTIPAPLQQMAPPFVAMPSYPPQPPLQPQPASYPYQPQPMYPPPPPQPPSPYGGAMYGSNNSSTIQYAHGVPPPM